MSKSNIRITVAICTRNRCGYLKNAIESVLPQLGEIAEILVIDNASTDQTATLLAELAVRDARVRSFREVKLGISNARNAALEQARGEWILFFDDDELAPKNWIQSYLRFLDERRDQRIGAVGGGCEPTFESPPPSWFDPQWARYDMGEEPINLDRKRTPGSGNCAYLRSLARELGGFSHELARAEDTDLNLRIQRAGYEVWWLPGAAITHLIPAAQMKLRTIWRRAITDGRSRARLRRNSGNGAAFRFGRAVFAPIHALVLVGLSVLILPFSNGKASVRSIQRAARSLGMGWQLLADLCARRPLR